MTTSVDREMLEPRRLLAAFINGTALIVEGTGGNDLLFVGIDTSDTSRLVVNQNSQQDFFPISAVNKIRIYALPGDDNVSVGSGGNLLLIPVTVYGGDGNDVIGSVLTAEEQFRAYGDAGNDTINVSGQSRDFLYGGAGNDTLGGNGGRDFMSGDGDADNLNGGSGNDRLFGGDGNDSINGGEGSIDAPNKDYIDGGAGNDNLNGKFSNDTIFGREGDDTIYGGAARDEIDGGAGRDLVHGEAGNDTVFGGNGGGDRVRGGLDRDDFFREEFDVGAVRDFEEGIDRVVD